MYGWQNLYELNTQMAPLALLPQLKHLSVSSLHGREFHNLRIFEPKDKFTSTTNLKKLTLRHSLITEADLKRILRMTQHLEELECDLQYNRRHGESCRGHRIHEALSLISGTLTSLKLTIAYNYLFLAVLSILPTMNTFKKLRYTSLTSRQTIDLAEIFSRSLDIPFILMIPITGHISERTIAEFLPEDLNQLDLESIPMIQDTKRRFLAFVVLHRHITKKPYLKGTDMDQLLFPASVYPEFYN